VVITGMGVISPLGLDVESFWANLTSGISGVDYISFFDTENYATRIAAEIKYFNPTDYLEKKEARRMDRFTHFAMAAAGQAIKDADLKLETLNRERIGVILGSGIGGIGTLEEQHNILINRGPDRISPFFITMLIPNMGAGQIAIAYGLKGYNMATVSACASSNNALGDAYNVIKQGHADVMIAGGAEAPITPLAMAGFCSMKAMSTYNEEPKKASRPFDSNRDGFVIGEGSAMLVLENTEHALARGANIYAEIAGYGCTCDAYHVTAPEPDGKGAAKAMELAILDAGVSISDVDYINAHGTSTPLGDKVETMAIKHLFNSSASRLAVSSTKSMTGHLLGAAGGIEAVTCIMTICKKIVPPTINYDNPDPECDLDYVPHKARSMSVKVALNNSLGFGGHNVSLLFREFEK